MASYLSWGLNAALVVAGCFLTADLANGIIAEWVASPTTAPVAETKAAATPDPATPRDPRIIVQKNLFKSAQKPADGKPIEAENGPLEATNLPLRLLGTIASPNVDLARAALEDTELRERLVVEVGDRIKERATVYRIEQRRIVLAENDALRELSLDDDKPAAPAPAVRRASDRARRAPPPRAARPARARNTPPSLTRDDVSEVLRDPTKLFQQARFLPKYDNGEMLGLEISAIKPGSILEEIGLGDGDLIIEANGQPMTSPTSSGALFRELNEATEVVLGITRADGSSDEIEVPIDE